MTHVSRESGASNWATLQCEPPSVEYSTLLTPRVPAKATPATSIVPIGTMSPSSGVSMRDIVQPLGGLHRVAPRDQDAGGKPVAPRQRPVVQLVDDEDLRRALDDAQGKALGVTVARLEADPACLGLR